MVSLIYSGVVQPQLVSTFEIQIGSRTWRSPWGWLAMHQTIVVVCEIFATFLFHGCDDVLRASHWARCRARSSSSPPSTRVGTAIQRIKAILFNMGGLLREVETNLTFGCDRCVSGRKKPHFPMRHCAQCCANAMLVRRGTTRTS